MTSPSVAETYHELTKYTPESIASGSRRLDFAAQPASFKHYPRAEVVDLTQHLPDGDELRDDEALSLWRGALPVVARAQADLSHLLYFTNGVTGLVPQPGNPLLMRAAPSAGALYPTEIYVVARGHAGLEDGIYNYQVRDHALARLCDAPSTAALQRACLADPDAGEADVLVVFTGVFARSAWRYEDRAYRRILLDTGHVIGNATLWAPTVGRHLRPLGGFSDEAWEELLFLDPAEEGVLAVAVLSPVPREAPVAVWPGGRHTGGAVAAGGRLGALHEATRLATGSGQPVRADAESGAGAAARLMPGVALQEEPLSLGTHVGTTILGRRSCRGYTGEGVSRADLAALLAFAYAGRSDLVVPGLLQTWMVVHDVEGMEPGCYRYDPVGRVAHQVRFTGLREPMYRLALGQDLAGDAAFVVIHTADLPDAVARLGDRAYRHLHLDAGHLGQRLNLGAVRQGLGASGIGGFFDDAVNELVGIPTHLAVLYLTTIGVPAAGGRRP